MHLVLFSPDYPRHVQLFKVHFSWTSKSFSQARKSCLWTSKLKCKLMIYTIFCIHIGLKLCHERIHDTYKHSWHISYYESIYQDRKKVILRPKMCKVCMCMDIHISGKISHLIKTLKKNYLKFICLFKKYERRFFH